MAEKKKVLLLGGLLMDRYLLADRYPGRGEDALVREERRQAGGCPLNAARVLASLGAEPVLYSALGEDEMDLVLEDPSLEEKQKAFDLLRMADRVLAPMDCQGEARRFLPSDLPALYTLNENKIGRASCRERVY